MRAIFIAHNRAVEQHHLLFRFRSHSNLHLINGIEVSCFTDDLRFFVRLSTCSWTFARYPILVRSLPGYLFLTTAPPVTS